MAERTSRNLDIVIRVQDQATASIARLEQQLTAFGRSVAATTQRTQAAVAHVGPGARQIGGGIGSVAQAQLQQARQAHQAMLQAERQAHQASLQAARQAHQARLQADRQAYQEQVRLARQAAQERARAEREAQQAARRSDIGFGFQTGGLLGGARAGATALGDMVGISAGAVAGITALGASLLIVTTNAAQTAAQLLNLQNRFTAATGSTAAGAVEFRRVSQLANRLGVDITALGTSYASFTAAARGTNLEGEQARRVFESITQASVRMGLSGEQTTRALNAVQQAISKGTLSAEELRQQLSEALPGSFQLTARALGVTTQALGDMLQKGQVLSDVWAVKFAQQLNKEAGPAVERLGVGAARLGNVMKELGVIVGGPFARAWDTAANSLAGFLSRLLGVGTAIDETNRKIREQTGATIKELERLTAAERERLRVAGLPDPRGTRATGRDTQLEILRQANQRAIEHAAEVARFARGVAEDDRAKQAAAAQKVLEESFKNTQAQQQKYFESLAKIMDESELLTAKNAALTKTYNELLDQIEKLTEADRAQRDTLIQQATQLDKQIDTHEKRLAQIRKEAQDRKELTDQQQRDAAAATQRDLEARGRLEARNIQLKQGDEAMRNFQDRLAAMSEEERHAALAHLRTAAALAQENETLRAQKQLLEDAKTLQEVINQTSMAREARRPFQEARPFGERERSRADESDVVDRLMQDDPQAYIDSLMRGLRGSGFTAGLPEMTNAYDQAMQQMLQATTPWDTKLRETMMFMQTTMPETFHALQQQYEEQFGVILKMTADVEQQILGLGDSITNTIGQNFLDLLHNTDDALHNLGDWLENFGKSLITLFGEEIIQLGLTPLRAALKDFAEELVRNEAIKKLMTTIVNFVGNIFGGAAGGINIGGAGTTSLAGASGTSFLTSAHGGIFGVQAMARGGLVSAPSLRLLGEATPEAVVPLTAEGISRFTRGLQRGAGGQEAPGTADLQAMNRQWKEAIDQLSKRPIVVEVHINQPVDMSQMRTTPAEIVQVVGKDITNDGVLRRIIIQKAQR